jgi:hypothetical protein
MLAPVLSENHSSIDARIGRYPERILLMTCMAIFSLRERA